MNTDQFLYFYNIDPKGFRLRIMKNKFCINHEI